MGFITKQWLKGEVLRNRSYRPVNSSISGKAASGNWSETNKVVFELIAESRLDGKLQVMSLTHSEVDKILPQIATVAEARTLLKVASEITAKLSDAELLSFISSVLSKRQGKAAGSAS